MPGTAAKVVFTEMQMHMLEEIVASRTASVRLVQRAQIILLAYQKRNNEQIGDVVGLNPQQVSVWRKRWKAKQEYLIRVECNETKAALRREIEIVLADRPRKGRDSKFTTQQQAAIVAIACEYPDDLRRQLPVFFALTHSFCYRSTIVASTEYYRNPEVNDGKKGKTRTRGVSAGTLPAV